jgi:hypothetical protein
MGMRALDQVGGRLIDASGSLAAEVVAAVADQVGPYRELLTVGSESARRSLERSVDVYLACLVGDRTLDDEEVAAFETLGAQRARQGVPLDAVTAAVEVASRTGWQSLLGLVDRLDLGLDVRHEAVRRMSIRAMQLGHLIVEALRRGYAAERVRRHLAGGPEVTIVDRLIDGDWLDASEVDKAARPLGLDLSRGVAVVAVVVPVRRRRESITPDARAVAGRLPAALASASRSWQIDHGVVLASAADLKALAARLRIAARETSSLLVTADASRSTLAIASEYRSLSRDLAFADAVRDTPGVITRRDLKFYRILAGGDESDRADFFHLVFGRLLAMPHEDAAVLFEVIDTQFVSEGTHKNIAAALSCTDRTVRTRLSAISRLTGLSWKRPSERVQMEVAARLRHVAVLSGSYDPTAWGPYPERGARPTG